ncbi:hypothetical protein EHP00_777 [Ecytonucleospora hepatopenaei]|uniref:Uncharacterized protein n=1 Tax=Ecytonucleospora hepatopenaei TaxID=646526 RepID=A0A1W0E7S9_9MICR|nr:hypothetical protein EHP00_777 [Ecytonucleospora hepatopenaei]
MFLWILSVICNTVQEKELMEKGKNVFYQEVTENDELASVSIYVITRNASVRVSMTHTKVRGKSNNFKKEGNLENKESSTSEGEKAVKNSTKIEESSFSELDEDFDDIGELVHNEWRKKLTKKGMYCIQVHNPSKKSVEYSISAYSIKKTNEETKAFDNFKNTLQTLASLLDKVKAENYYFNVQQNKNIKEARNIRRLVNFLILFPILTVVIGWVKHAIARHMVKPSKKKFANVF